jgi:hypothetical protein
LISREKDVSVADLLSFPNDIIHWDFHFTRSVQDCELIDNLRKRYIIIVDWCCMCKVSGESVDHLLLHCSIAWGLWSLVFSMFGVNWVLLGHVFMGCLAG